MQVPADESGDPTTPVAQVVEPPEPARQVSSTLLINRSYGETRVAMIEDQKLCELLIETEEETGIVGNIYKGRVTRVLPGLQAAFVDIGLKRAAFLHAKDIIDPNPKPPRHESKPPGSEPTKENERPNPPREMPRIETRIKARQEILVQVSKEPPGNKGPRITEYISIPGRRLVLMPNQKKVGVSRRIEDADEKNRLRELVQTLSDECGLGIIARTVCENEDEEKLRQDLAFVCTIWDEVSLKAASTRGPALVYSELDIVLRAARDLAHDNVSRIVVDDPTDFARLKTMLQTNTPHLVDRCELWSEAEPLFDHYRIEQTIDRALERETSLSNGASIVIDETEAFTAIDVNTGRFVGSQDLETTILETNLAAAAEIAAQIRLRNLGGIIVADFIDMEQQENRAKVYDAFLAALTRDRAKTQVAPMSELGLIELTRKRVRPSLAHVLTTPCPYCEGRARLRSKRTVCYQLFRELDRESLKQPAGSLVVTTTPEIAHMLAHSEHHRLSAIELELGRSIVVEPNPDLHQEAFSVSVRPEPSSPQ